MVGFNNLVTFFKGFCGFGLGWRITKCMLKDIVFDYYLFGVHFGMEVGCNGGWSLKHGLLFCVFFCWYFFGWISLELLWG